MFQLSDYLADIPKLHSWDDGKTWNTGGFERSHFEALAALIGRESPRPTRFIETGAGNSTIFFLLQSPQLVVSIAPDPSLFERIDAYCAQRGISEAPLEKRVEGSQWALPKLIAGGSGDFDFGLIDGCHGWPMVFVDFQYLNYILRPGGLLMVDDTQIHSAGELARLLREEPGYEVALDVGKAVVFRKLDEGRELGDWFTQPYIARHSYTKPPRWRRRLRRLARRVGLDRMGYFKSGPSPGP